MPDLDYFEVLGLDEDASQDEVEGRYQALVAHLGGVEQKAGLGAWASRQRDLVEEAYFVLSSPSRRSRYEAELRRAPGPSPSRRSARRARTGREEGSRGGLLAGGVLRLVATGVGLGGVVLAAFFLVFFLMSGGDEDSDALRGGQMVEPGPTVDTVRVRSLEAVLEDDPQNLDALLGLSDAYFRGADWEGMLYWAERAREAAPEDLDAILDVGTAHMNLGNFSAAAEAWNRAAELYPDEARVHYNLAFLYAFGEPRDEKRALEEGDRVLELAPDSELALWVHFDRGRMYLTADPPDLDAWRAEWGTVLEKAPDSELARQIQELFAIHGGMTSPTPTG